MEILKVENLTKKYGKGENEVIAVNNLSFSVESSHSCGLASVVTGGLSPILSVSVSVGSNLWLDESSCPLSV